MAVLSNLSLGHIFDLTLVLQDSIAHWVGRAAVWKPECASSNPARANKFFADANSVRNEIIFQDGSKIRAYIKNVHEMWPFQQQQLKRSVTVAENCSQYLQLISS